MKAGDKVELLYMGGLDPVAIPKNKIGKVLYTTSGYNQEPLLYVRFSSGEERELYRKRFRLVKNGCFADWYRTHK